MWLRLGLGEVTGISFLGDEVMVSRGFGEAFWK